MIFKYSNKSIHIRWPHHNAEPRICPNENAPLGLLQSYRGKTATQVTGLGVANGDAVVWDGEGNQTTKSDTNTPLNELVPRDERRQRNVKDGFRSIHSVVWT